IQVMLLTQLSSVYDESVAASEPGDVEAAMQTASAIGDDRLQRQSQGYVVPDSFTAKWQFIAPGSPKRQRDNPVRACSSTRTCRVLASALPIPRCASCTFGSKPSRFCTWWPISCAIT